MTLLYYSATVIINTEVEHTILVSIFEIRYTLIGVKQIMRFLNYHAIVIINKQYVQSYVSVDIFIEIIVLIVYCLFTTNYVFQLTDWTGIQYYDYDFGESVRLLSIRNSAIDMFIGISMIWSGFVKGIGRRNLHTTAAGKLFKII